MGVFLKQSLFRPVISLRVSLLSVSLVVSIVAFPLTSLYFPLLSVSSLSLLCKNRIRKDFVPPLPFLTRIILCQSVHHLLSFLCLSENAHSLDLYLYSFLSNSSLRLICQTWLLTSLPLLLVWLHYEVKEVEEVFDVTWGHRRAVSLLVLMWCRWGRVAPLSIGVP